MTEITGAGGVRVTEVPAAPEWQAGAPQSFSFQQSPFSTCALHWAWQPSFKCHLIFIFKYNYKVFTVRYRPSANVSRLICAGFLMSVNSWLLCCILMAWWHSSSQRAPLLSLSPPSLPPSLSSILLTFFHFKMRSNKEISYLTLHLCCNAHKADGVECSLQMNIIDWKRNQYC